MSEGRGKERGRDEEGKGWVDYVLFQCVDRGRGRGDAL